MTISGHNMVMKQVGIAALKSHLSEHLRAVQRGESISVLDRRTPIAEIVPVRGRELLSIRYPAPDAPPLNRVPLPKFPKLNLDILDLLLEERQDYR